jgi:chaperonin GroEL (HSP60 family)
MPHKRLLFRSEAREKVLRGATAIADAVRVTLGPRSRSVLIERKWGKPIVCNGGVTGTRVPRRRCSIRPPCSWGNWFADD